MEEVPLVISPSSLRTWLRCKRQYYYKYVEGLEARLPDIKLKRGSWMHECLQYHYMGRDWKVAHKRLTKKFNTMFLEEREYYGDLPDQVERMMKSYLYHYREDNWEVLFVEETFKVDHPAFEEKFEFKPDLIVYDKDTKQTICWDHKTVKSIPSGEFRIQDLQSALYTWGLKVVDVEINAFGWNYIRTKDPTVPKINLNGEISRRKIDTDFYTLASFLKEYYGTLEGLPAAWRTRLNTLKYTNTYFRRSKVVKSEAITSRLVAEMDYSTQEMQSWYDLSDEHPMQDPWVRTMISSCDWDCDFQELCIHELLGGDGKFIRRNKFKPSTYLEGRTVGRRKQTD